LYPVLFLKLKLCSYHNIYPDRVHVPELLFCA
jgi:hypothetical protein